MKNAYPIHIVAKDQEGGLCILDADMGQPLSAIRDGKQLQKFLPKGLRPVLMAGFSSLFPGQEIPISPAFQLNADLSRCSDSLLLAQARADLVREAAQNFRSYTVEPDFRCAVISADPGLLQEFIHTWGGMLELFPFLFKGATSPDFICASEMELAEKDKGVVIRFREPVPVDMERCTCCGECAWICPEDAILPGPLLDLSKCSLCGKCVELCSHGAIDLHALVQGETELPRAILLPDVAEEFFAQYPDLKGKLLLSQDEMTSLFSELFPQQVDEVITHNHILCQFSQRMGIGCKRCVESCSTGALAIRDGEIVLDQMACVECGACAAVCPTGAIQYERFSDQAFFAAIREFVAEEHDAIQEELASMSLVIGREEDLERIWWLRGRLKEVQSPPFFMEHPEPRAMSSMNLLALLDLGVRQVIVLDGQEERDGAAPFFRALSQARQIAAAALGRPGAIHLVSLGRKMVDDLNMLLAAADQDGDAARADIAKSVISGIDGFPGRRDLLARVVQGHLAARGWPDSSIRLFAGPGDEKISHPFQDLELDQELCTQCLACINECRTGALDAREDEMSLLFTPVRCVSCGICTSVCPENALTSLPGLGLAPEFFAVRKLFAAEPARCRKCGKVYGTRKSLDRIKSLLSSRNDLDLEIFDLCEDCRVRSMFEER